MDNLLEPRLPTAQTQPTQPTINYGGFRSFVLKRHPNISQQQIQQLDETIAKRQRADLVRAGVLDVGELDKTDPGAAVKLANEGFSVAGNIPADKQLLARAGVESLDVARGLFEKDPGVIWKQAVPGKLFSRQFDSALFSAVNSLLRAQTGAVAPEHEIRAYMSAYGPVIGDTPQDVAFKFDRLKNILNQYLPSNMPTGYAQTKSGLQNNDPLGIR